MKIPAPKPHNWRDLVDAWDRPEEFAALADAYYAAIGAQRARECQDITEPMRGGEE